MIGISDLEKTVEGRGILEKIKTFNVLSPTGEIAEFLGEKNGELFWECLTYCGNDEVMLPLRYDHSLIVKNKNMETVRVEYGVYLYDDFWTFPSFDNWPYDDNEKAKHTRLYNPPEKFAPSPPNNIIGV
jgi:hypothetical protein